jgi:hypothetical protein
LLESPLQPISQSTSTNISHHGGTKFNRHGLDFEMAEPSQFLVERLEQRARCNAGGTQDRAVQVDCADSTTGAELPIGSENSHYLEGRG